MDRPGYTNGLAFFCLENLLPYKVIQQMGQLSFLSRNVIFKYRLVMLLIYLSNH